MTAPKYIFTVTAGRSGQATLTALLEAHVPGCLALFEEPQIQPRFPGFLSDLERRYRRNFVETHELLGRGRVISAFENDDTARLDKYAAARLAWLERCAAEADAEIVFDVSKYFVRGMHRAIVRAKPDIGLIRLVRDPIMNLRSFLNRGKNFFLDNNNPNNVHNQLRLEIDRGNAAELYLWAWCEVYLRFDALVSEFEIAPSIEIRTEDLNDSEKMDAHFNALGLEHSPVEVILPRNSNTRSGFKETNALAVDVESFERFCDKLPKEILDRIAYFDTYEPRRHLAAINPN